MALTLAVSKTSGEPVYLVDEYCHPQTIAVVQTRAEARGIKVVVGEPETFAFEPGVIGALVQYPATDGAVRDFRSLAERAHAAGALVTAATDLLALTLLTPPGEWGADIAIGNSQRFGVPMGYGGPHAAFFATREAYKRFMPGRIIGVSRDRDGRPALRMALQTREQHIRRDKATSNVCTAQVLLAVMASMYAVYHGPGGLRRIAERVHTRTVVLANALRRLRYRIVHEAYFDTLCVEVPEWALPRLLDAARVRQINLRPLPPTRLCIALDETVTLGDLADLIAVFSLNEALPFMLDDIGIKSERAIPPALERKSSYLDHPVFHRHHSETEMLRYIKRLEARDLSLTSAMIPLGSCTMKLNATTEMMPVSWREFNRLHPFAPRDQAAGYELLFSQLEYQLAEITGFAAVSLQPNAGSQGEYAGLLVIRAYHRARGDDHRTTCLIPQSAHGTNPASAVMAGMQVVPVKSDADGNIDLADLEAKAEAHRDTLAALMVTYPSTHGVFEGSIREICRVVHEHGGQVYMDGANMNAQVGSLPPGRHRGRRLPSQSAQDVLHPPRRRRPGHGTDRRGEAPGAVPSGPSDRGSRPRPGLRHGVRGALGERRDPSDLLGVHRADGLRRAHRGDQDRDPQRELHRAAAQGPLRGALRRRPNGLVAHECIIDTRPFKASAGVDVEDIAKRIIDYGFHPPTVSFPVAGTLMIEPTESESKEELDRFCDAMIAIREEIREVEDGRADREVNLLTSAPHTLEQVIADGWDRPYPRERAAYPSARGAGAQGVADRRPDRQRVRRPEPGLRVSADGGVCRVAGQRGGGAAGQLANRAGFQLCHAAAVLPRRPAALPPRWTWLIDLTAARPAQHGPRPSHARARRPGRAVAAALPLGPPLPLVRAARAGGAAVRPRADRRRWGSTWCGGRPAAAPCGTRTS